jgi:hypothetical protein
MLELLDDLLVKKTDTNFVYDVIMSNLWKLIDTKKSLYHPDSPVRQTYETIRLETTIHNSIKDTDLSLLPLAEQSMFRELNKRLLEIDPYNK